VPSVLVAEGLRVALVRGRLGNYKFGLRLNWCLSFSWELWYDKRTHLTSWFTKFLS